MKKHSGRKHALLSASGSSRWLNCTPSARMEEEFDSKTSEFAEEGTLAHEFAELGLLVESGRISLSEYNTKAEELRKSKYYDPELLNEVSKYVYFCMERFNESKKTHTYSDMHIEQRLDFSAYVEEGFGTGDNLLLYGQTMDVIDLKFGRGVQVNAEENTQLMLYGLGALENFGLLYDIQTVNLIIVQPRLNHVSEWSISVNDLIKWGEEVVKVAAAKAYNGEGETCAGSWCRWCKAKARCRTLAEENMELAKAEFSDPKKLSDSELLEIYNQSDRITEWVNAVAEYMLLEAIKGKAWEGFKLVEGRTQRKWTDDAEVINKLTELGYSYDDFINSKLKGIGDIEKLIGKKVFFDAMESLVEKPKGKPTLAPLTDKRPPFINDAVSDFS